MPRRKPLSDTLPVWAQVALYGAALAAGAVLLQWLDYQRLARTRPGELYVVLVAAGFLAVGVLVGARLFRKAPPPAFDGNPRAAAALGLTPRELTVLEEIAAGRSNKEVARRLKVSPETVKTHVARLLGKLGATRRGDAVARARELGLLP
ncbi:MAG TPA: response regulator transcription factor [Caulobacteraceae bacterium]|nr:response regulator transcription factor [Caulobacteraceae bacterium]